ncbi:hypothetical protein SAMN05216228_101659 [Rhizobium tibeticum]|uniref:Uncharacterized protein n=1 Tax=Rhizobium tibeticum TaxID=501024 RepID=A0A1H8P894_9HYPH|nr:hypothetical protein RTCCBAU85039_3766 [Rhizobium tibeticum]SEO37954.1 hypothetical protein SAMN05216228_101659 [Rhizobium tibeticum]
MQPKMTQSQLLVMRGLLACEIRVEIEEKVGAVGVALMIAGRPHKIVRGQHVIREVPAVNEDR